VAHVGGIGLNQIIVEGITALAQDVIVTSQDAPASAKTTAIAACTEDTLPATATTAAQTTTASCGEFDLPPRSLEGVITPAGEPTPLG
jgi:hypothetical protein